MTMKTITKYLLEIRKNSIIYDLKLNGWKIYTTFLFLFLFAIIIENIFYLSTSLRFTTIITLLVLVTASLVLFVAIRLGFRFIGFF